MKNKAFFLFLAFFCIFLLLVGTFFFLKKEPVEESFSSLKQVKLDISDESIAWENFKSFEVELKEDLEINEEGIYHLKGTLIDGGITINTKGYVKLIFDNVSIKNSKGPALMILDSKTVVLELVENTSNYLEDGKSYIDLDEEVKGCIYSKSDFVIEGLGTLEIKANYKDGMVSKDDLKINNGTIIIESNDDGIRGKDSIYILNGNFNIKSKGDSFKTTNDALDEKGFIYIKNGNFTIDSRQDGFNAIKKLIIEQGQFLITTGGGSLTKNEKEEQFEGMFWNPSMDNKNNSSSKSTKGLKAGTDLIIESGQFKIDSLDDSIHSNGTIAILEGNFELSSSDDGIHADSEIQIKNGNIDIQKSYEGIESGQITIDGGVITVFSTDDGINVAGGKDGSSLNRPGANTFKQNSNSRLIVNNGTIYVHASGDGIDVNGSAYVNGGNIVVEGPTDNGNGALDYDGEFVVTGGSLFALGSSGMAQGISSNSKQYGFIAYLSKTYPKGTKIAIYQSDEQLITEFSSTKEFSNLVYSSEALRKEDSYVLKINDEKIETFTIQSVMTQLGEKRKDKESMKGPRR